MEFQKWNSSFRKGGFEVITTKLLRTSYIVNENSICGFSRSATKVRKILLMLAQD
jgi:hypothetical protein